MRLAELDYALDKASIAQRPLERRDGSRLLLLDRAASELEDRLFCDLPGLLEGGELLVLNDSRVLPARLFGERAGTEGRSPAGSPQTSRGPAKVELLLVRAVREGVWEALARPGRKVQVGDRVRFGAGELECLVTARGERGLRTLQFASRESRSFEELVERLGHVPLPPYIDRPDQTSDRERYQTIYAKNPGAVAAPTAGLHFSGEIMKAVRDRGAEFCELTLHVGLGTFEPVRTENLEEHVMHPESYQIGPEAADKINRAKSEGRPVLAIGTTVVRALEDAARKAKSRGERAPVVAGASETRLLITPGFEFQVVDQLLTNFHLPRSTLLALVCAFAGRDRVLSAYRHALGAGYRFYSYGDCMLLR